MAVNGLTEIEESAFELIKSPADEVFGKRNRLLFSWTADINV